MGTFYHEEDRSRHMRSHVKWMQHVQHDAALARTATSCLFGGVAEQSGNERAAVPVGISAAASVFIAWLIAGVSNQISFARSASETLRFDTRVLVHLYDAGHFLALGLVTAGLCGMVRRWGQGRMKTAFVGLAIGSLLLALLIVPMDLSAMKIRLAREHSPMTAMALYVASIVCIAATVPFAFVLGRLLARRYLRWLGMGGGATILCIHLLYLPYSYHSVHLFLGLAGATLFAASLTGAVLPERLTRGWSRQTSRPLRNGLLALCAAFAAVSIGRRPPASVGVELVRTDGFLLPHYVLRLLHPPTPLRQAPIPPEMQPWFVDRTNHPPIAPTTPPLIPDKPVVIFVTIDCMRADVIMSGKYDRQLRNFARLRNMATSFTQARSTASGTMASLASVFMGTHFSQQIWSRPRAGVELYAENSPRLQEILGKAGITTVTFTGAPGLTPRYRLLHGFTESTDMQESGKYATADVIIHAAADRLQRVTNEPIFMYLHLLDAHSPYNRGTQTGAPFNRYLSELHLVDTELGKLMRFIQVNPLYQRTLLIISADHGESFGQHGTVHHSSTIYDELLRVPLIIWRPLQPKFVVDEPVTLVDVAPTILDVFGLPTPGHFMGQSLVPFLRGEKPRLTRPILAEARLKQALVLPDGHKIIVDNRLNTVELFDLRTDPLELTSLADDEERLSTPLSLLRQFFQVHTNRTPGYKPPYRVW